MLREHLSSALRNWSTYPWRTGLTVLGIMIGVANIIALLGFAQSAKHQTTKIFNEIGADVFFVTPYFETEGPSLGTPASALATLPFSDLDTVREVDGVERASGIIFQPAWVRRETNQLHTGVVGTASDYRQYRRAPVAAGEFFSAEQEENAARVAVLGMTVKEDLFSDAEAVGREIVMGGEDFRVIGVLERTGSFGFSDIDNRVYIPTPVMRELFETSGVHNLLLKAASDPGVETVMERVRSKLRAKRGLAEDEKPDYRVFNIDTISQVRDETFSIFNTILIAVGAIALIVAGINILNVMLMAVMQRTREIGIRKASGARGRDILVQFLADAALQSLIGATLGAALGWSATWYFIERVGWEPYIPWTTLAGAVVFGLLIGTLFGLLPAVKAARTDPIDAIRYE